MLNILTSLIKKTMKVRGIENDVIHLINRFSAQIEVFGAIHVNLKSN
jgi:hypothetical protein